MIISCLDGAIVAYISLWRAWEYQSQDDRGEFRAIILF